MKTGFAALKFGTTLIIIPLSFVYVPELLLQGEVHRIVLVSICYLIGYATLAIGIQGRDFFFGKISTFVRILFILTAACFLFPLIYWLKAVGIILLISSYVLIKFNPDPNEEQQVSLKKPN